MSFSCPAHAASRIASSCSVSSINITRCSRMSSYMGRTQGSVGMLDCEIMAVTSVKHYTPHIRWSAWALYYAVCLRPGGPRIDQEDPILATTTEGREALQIRRAKRL